MATGDAVQVQARWIRRDFDQASERGRVHVGYCVRNSGSNVWDNVTYFVRAHLLRGTDREYVRDPLIEFGGVLPSTLGPGEWFTGILTIGSNADVPVGALYHPDTQLILNVVQEGVAWMPGQSGVIRVGDALDRGVSDFVARCVRADLVSGVVLNTLVPTDPGGPRGEILSPATAPAGRTHYLVSADFAVTGATQRVIARYTPAEDGVERIVGVWQLPIGTTPVSLDGRRLAPGDSFRMDAEPNEEAGGINTTLTYVDLPWLEGPAVPAT